MTDTHLHSDEELTDSDFHIVRLQLLKRVQRSDQLSTIAGSLWTGRVPIGNERISSYSHQNVRPDPEPGYQTARGGETDTHYQLQREWPM